jgi:outer membrane phospholipase A
LNNNNNLTQNKIKIQLKTHGAIINTISIKTKLLGSKIKKKLSKQSIPFYAMNNKAFLFRRRKFKIKKREKKNLADR